MKTIAMLFLISLMGLSACQEQGPAERAGESVDEAIEDAGDSIEDAGDAIEDATDN
jgi:hypothetical protein